MDIYELHQAVIDGHKKALPAFIELKKQADAMNLVLEALKDLATEEFYQEWGGKEQSIAGATVSSHAGGRYSYDNDATWMRLDSARKDREALMKDALKSEGEVVDPETGEIIPPAKYLPNREGISIKLPKG
jgi:hypothetical protein